MPVQRRQFLQKSGQVAAATVATVAGLRAKAENMNPIGTPPGGIAHLVYPLNAGYVDHWLLAGPQVAVVPNADYTRLPAERTKVQEQYGHPTADPLAGRGLPVEGAAFALAGSLAGAGGLVASTSAPAWRVVACADDHLVDQPAWFGSGRYLRGWTYTELVNDGPAACPLTAQWQTNGPLDVWLNGAHVHRAEPFSLNNLVASSCELTLVPGVNRLLVRREIVFAQGGPYGLVCRLVDPSGNTPVAGVSCRVPVRGGGDVAGRQRREAALKAAYLTRDTYASGQEIRLQVPRLATPGSIKILLRGGNTTHAEAHWDSTTGDFVSLGDVARLAPGDYRVELIAPDDTQTLRLRVQPPGWTATPRPGTTFAARKQECLEAAIKRAAPPRPAGARVNEWSGWEVRAEIAKMETGRWDALNVPNLIAFLDGITRLEDGADFRLVELLGMQARYGAHPRYPATLTDALRECALHFKYWQDEPGHSALVYVTENHKLAFHTAEILAGQLYPDAVFPRNGQTGAWRQAHGEKMAIEWLQTRAARGFDEWDANGYLPADAVLLSHLVYLARSPRIQAGAKAVLDKIFLSIALSSYRGNFGSTHGRTSVEYIKDARSEPVACIAYLAWGVGIVNPDHIDETVSLAVFGYEPPAVIRAIALDQTGTMWARDKQSGTNKATYKTPDGMLCSAQDWNAGKGGYQQHIWQATLGPDAVVFANSPACISTDGNHRPNFWAGNATLPRVAQWHNTLIALYPGRAEDLLDYTHAFFPVYAFDECLFTDGWAFARHGDGYVALTVSGGATLTRTGENAGRELRSGSKRAAWVCHLGRRAMDGAFADFAQKCLAARPTFDDLATRFHAPGGPEIAFAPTGPLRVDGRETPITNFNHFDSPYCVAPWPADRLVVRHGGAEYVINCTI